MRNAKEDHHARARASAAVIAAGLIIAVGALPAGAAHGPEAPGGPYSGYASGAAIHADVLTTDSARLVDVEVGTADAAADATGLQQILNAHDRPVVPDGMSDKHTRARSSLLEVGAGLQPPSAENQLAPFVAESAGPGGEEVDDSLLNQTVATLIHASLLRRAAAANWNDETCVIGEPLAIGEEHLARVELLETSEDESTEAEQGFDAALLGIDANTSGPRRASTHVVSKEQLFLGSNGNFGLQSVITETLAPITLFEGTDNQVTIEIDGPAYLSATADGTPGGARAIYRAPTVSVIQGDELTEVLPGEPIRLRLPDQPSALLEVKLGTIDPLAGSGLGDETTASNGTKAAAEAHVVEVKVIDALDPELRGLTLALGHMEAFSEVPAGGIECPIPVDKTASETEVSPGDIFTTTITVSNPFECTLTNLSLTDVIGTRQQAQFEVTRVTRGGSRPGGSGLTNATLDWDDLGSLGPGEEISVEVTQQAQGGAGVIEDTATAEGTLTDCPAGFDSAKADVSVLATAKVDVEGSSTLLVNETVVLGQRLAPTGIATVASMLGGGLLLGAAGALGVRLRRPLR